MTTERTAVPGDRRTTVLPPGPEAAAAARAFVADHGRQLPPALLDDAQLCVSELVSNAVLHGLPEITLELRTEPPGMRIGIGVTDHGPGIPATAGGHPDATDPHGRGLMIVAALAHSWGVVRQDNDGVLPSKTVWFQLSL